MPAPAMSPPCDERGNPPAKQLTPKHFESSLAPAHQVFTVNTFIVLICVLNIRAHNRIALSDQIRLLQTCSDLISIRHAGDKGSYIHRDDKI